MNFAGESSGGNKDEKRSWSDVVVDSENCLRFIEIPDSALEGDVLKIPKEILERGAKRLRSAAVAQFLGKAPPIRVFSSVANRLWGYEGPVIISVIADGFFLIEFHSESLCDWVLGRSWHIHNTALVMRQWQKGIAPMVFSPTATPEWITFRKVPPAMIDLEGISWLSSRIGKPMKKFVREGIDVKVCLLRDRTTPCPRVLKVELEDGEVCDIEVVQMQAREYGRKPPTKAVYVVKNASKEIINEEKVESDPAPESEAQPTNPTSDETKKKRRKKKKKAVKVSKKDDKTGDESSEVDETFDIQDEQAQSTPRVGTSVAGSESAPSVQGTDSASKEERPALIIEETSNDVGMEGTPQKDIVSPEQVNDIEDIISTIEKTQKDEWTHDGHKANFGIFLQHSKPAKSKQLRFISGVKTRHKNRQR
ncbi:hypothetical protein LINPERPRIM_LOCUS38106 [Linum perenne]